MQIQQLRRATAAGFTMVALGLAGASGASAQTGVFLPGGDDAPDANGMLGAGAANAAQIEADATKGCHASAELVGSSTSTTVKSIHWLKCDRAQYHIGIYGAMTRDNRANGGNVGFAEDANNCYGISSCGVTLEKNNGPGTQIWHAHSQTVWKARWWSIKHYSVATSGERRW